MSPRGKDSVYSERIPVVVSLSRMKFGTPHRDQGSENYMYLGFPENSRLRFSTSVSPKPLRPRTRRSQIGPSLRTVGMVTSETVDGSFDTLTRHRGGRDPGGGSNHRQKE